MQTSTHRRPIRAALVGAILVMACSAAAAQWVLLARHAIGRVEQMQQSSPAAGVGASYDVATVIVEVEPDKVFAAVLRRLNANPEVKVTQTDAAKRSVEFSDGKQIGGIQVSALGDKLSQLLVSTAHPGVPGAVSSTLVDRILAVCKELGVSCERSSG
jgi:hypothetical protein